MWIFRRVWCRPRGGARLLSFGWGGLPWSHENQFMGQICKKHKENERGSRNGRKMACKGKEWSASIVFIGPKIFTASPQQMALRSGEECLCSDVETFTAAYLKVGKGVHSGEGFSAAMYQEGM